MDVVEEVKRKEVEDRNKPFIAIREFWTDAVTKSDGSIAMEDFVSWVKKGQTIQDEYRSQIRFMPKYYTLEWAYIEPRYKAWKAQEDAPIDGTPLTVWPGSNKPFIKIMSQVNIRSVEDFCNMEDSAIGKMAFPGLRKMQQDCKRFRTHLEESAPQLAKMAELEEKLEFLARENAELRELHEAKAQESPTRRGPGRPPKVEAA